MILHPRPVIQRELGADALAVDAHVQLNHGPPLAPPVGAHDPTISGEGQFQGHALFAVGRQDESNNPLVLHSPHLDGSGVQRRYGGPGIHSRTNLQTPRKEDRLFGRTEDGKRGSLQAPGRDGPATEDRHSNERADSTHGFLSPPARFYGEHSFAHKRVLRFRVRRATCHLPSCDRRARQPGRQRHVRVRTAERADLPMDASPSPDSPSPSRDATKPPPGAVDSSRRALPWIIRRAAARFPRYPRRGRRATWSRARIP